MSSISSHLDEKVDEKHLFDKSNFECAVCLDILKDPVIICYMGHVFCRECIMRLEGEKKCPMCREKVLQHFIPCRKSMELMACVDWKCSCGWKGNLGNKHEHHEICNVNEFLTCRYPNCTVERYPRDMHMHSKMCLYRRMGSQEFVYDCNDIPDEILYYTAQDFSNEQDLSIQGICYEHGIGVERNLEKAFACYQQSFNETGMVDSLYKIAICYLNGIGVDQDKSKACTLLQEAIDLGSLNAQTLLAICYSNGEGVPKDRTMSLQLLEEAMKRGCIHAQAYYGYVVVHNFNNNIGELTKGLMAALQAARESQSVAIFIVGFCCLYGFGMETNQGKGIAYLEEAIDQGYFSAQSVLASFYNRIGNHTMALNLLIKASKRGDSFAMRMLGHCYCSGHCGVSKNLNVAFDWMKKAAIKGDVIAQFELARYYKDGIGTKQNQSLAIHYYKSAGMKGHAEAYYRLGTLYLNTDIKVGIDWFQKAKELGCVEAQFSLGILHLIGKGYEKNQDLGIKLIKEALDKFDVKKVFDLAKLVSSGNLAGGKQLEEHLLRHAAERGHQDARELLEER